MRERLGGSKGCVHLIDLLHPIATVAFHTVRWSRDRAKITRPRPPINSCHVSTSDGELVHTEWADYYRTP